MTSVTCIKTCITKLKTSFIRPSEATSWNISMISLYVNSPGRFLH